jgi:hypothetical protein
MKNNYENIKIGYPLLWIGLVMAVIELSIVIWAYIVTNEYHQFKVSVANYLVIMGLFLIKIEEMIDNQREMIEVLKNKNETVE